MTIRLSRLRDQVSSMKPVARLISAWNTTWNSTMPESRNAAPACSADAPPLRLPKYTPIAPNRIESTTGQTTTSNQR